VPASRIHRKVQTLANPSRAAFAARFFKTGPGDYGAGDRFLGIRVPVLRKLALQHQALPLRGLAGLLRSSWHEERLLALFILVRQYAGAGPAQRAAIYRLYMSNTGRINNWDLVDCSASQIVGAHLCDRGRTPLVRLARSALLWERRIAIMATFHYIKRGEFTDTLRVARLLRDDPQDLIHKAVGWMLREVGKRDRAVELAFLRRHADRMPRTMLRYAIERFPARLRRRYLAAPRAGPTDKRREARLQGPVR
jgi:3-methyladenine DNA glycosylase AlkD